METASKSPGRRQTALRCLVGLVVASRIGLAPPAEAVSGPSYSSALDRLDVAVARGELGYADSARLKLFYLFDRSRMDSSWGAAEDPPARCGTRVLAELGANLDRLDSETRSLYTHYTRLSTVENEPQAPNVHQTAHFRIEYATSGPDAPPATDVNPANGTPDFVERTGEACDLSWAVEVDALGYIAPQLNGGPQGKYVIEYQSQNSYGFTVVVSGQRTKIVLHPSYAGFPPNADPDGDALGSLRATVAHELKHAIQRMYTNWTEGGFMELDATWIEDIVYDQTNDYYNFVAGAGSPFTQPQVSLAGAGGAGYEDCNWQHYQTESLGNVVMRTFWERRSTTVEPVMITYAANLATYGVALADAWGEYAAWNCASGERAGSGSGYGYGEAAGYPTPPASFTFTTLPVATTSWSVPGMAANNVLIQNPDGGLAGIPEFTFAGNDNPAVYWSVSVLLRDRAGVVIRVPMMLSGAAGTLLLSSFDWADLEWAALVIGNATEAPLALPYSFSARTVAPIRITHQRLWNTASVASPYPVTARVAPGTAAVNPASVALTHRVNGGAPATAPMSPTGIPDEYAASIPAQPVGSTIEYRISAQSAAADPTSAPAIPGAFFSFQVVSLFEPFESSGNWTVGDAGDAATTGVWERAQPIGTIAAPYSDFTLPPGGVCFVTQNGTTGGAAGQADVDGGKTTLTSPVFVFYAGGGYVQAVASYRRWYSNHIGALSDDTWRVEVSNDGGGSWTNVETITTGENAWKTVTVDLLGLFGQPSQVRFRFVAEDIGDASLVEAAVDDFEVLATLQDLTGVDAPSARGIRLGPATPNPSRGAVTLPLQLGAPARVSATVRDVQGRLVRSISTGAPYPAGASSLSWDGRDGEGRETATGLYLIEVQVGGRRLTTRVVRVE